MSLDQAPQTAKKPLTEQIADIDTQINEAHLTYDTDLVAKLEMQKKSLEGKLAASQQEAEAQPESVAEIVANGDPVAIQKLDKEYAVTPYGEEALANEPLHDEHVLAQKAFIDKESNRIELEVKAKRELMDKKVTDIFKELASKSGLKEPERNRDMIQALVKVVSQNLASDDYTSDLWFQEALIANIRRPGNEPQKAVALELLSNNLLSLLALGEAPASKWKDVEQKEFMLLVREGMNETEAGIKAKERAQDLQRAYNEKIRKMYEILDKIGLSPQIFFQRSN